MLNNKEIPGLDGLPLELTWAGATSSAPTTPGSSTSFHKPAYTPYGSTATGRNGTLTSAGASANMKHATATTTNKSTAAGKTTTNGAGASGDDTDGDASSDKDVHILLDRPAPLLQDRDQNEMDYEVADEDQWGY